MSEDRHMEKVEEKGPRCEHRKNQRKVSKVITGLKKAAAIVNA